MNRPKRRVVFLEASQDVQATNPKLFKLLQESFESSENTDSSTKDAASTLQSDASIGITVDGFCTNRIGISTQHQHPFSCLLLENSRNE